MRTFDLVKSQIEKLDRKVNSIKEFEYFEPVVKRQRVNGKMEWILKNPETGKFSVITECEVDELNNLYHIAKTGISVEEDPFLFNA